ncbi:ABC transporter ATP-binding protein [soil metagenome]
MDAVVIRVENLGKRYQLGRSAPQEGARYRTLRDDLASGARNLFRRNGAQQPGEEFWALKDISFEVKQGEVVGIIGRNGAGKSTLLKILSRITEPTTGRISIRGRVASLLEVGTGFHQELTGRENIFLNGAILGMSRFETKKRFDEIVAFSEVEKFLDVPVKRYSSGMYVRLAFAVAAHMEPEILVVDEVLAVGDVEFQKKCLGRMNDVARQSNRTVLFVSHQMAAVEALCSRVVVLASGSVAFDGSCEAGVRFYLKDLNRRVERCDLRKLPRSGNGKLRLVGFSIQDASHTPVNAVASGDSVKVILDYESPEKEAIDRVTVGISIHDQKGDILSIFYSDYAGADFSLLRPVGCFICTLPDFPFSPGRYYVGARVLVNGLEADWPRDLLGYIDVEAGDFYGGGIASSHNVGPIMLRGSWAAGAARANETITS